MGAMTISLLLISLLTLCLAKVVPFEITLTWETAAPDGFERKVILTNGQLPGPPLYVDQGDDIEFSVLNLMPFETTVHFHGMLCLDIPLFNRYTRSSNTQQESINLALHGLMESLAFRNDLSSQDIHFCTSGMLTSMEVSSTILTTGARSMTVSTAPSVFDQETTLRDHSD
jgi:hypothetical protein